MAISVYDFCFRCPKCGYRRARCFSNNVCLTKGCGMDLTETIKEERSIYYKMLPFVYIGVFVVLGLLVLISVARVG